MNATEARKLSFLNIDKPTEREINVYFNSYRNYFLHLIECATYKGEFYIKTSIDTSIQKMHPEVLKEIYNNFEGMGYKISISRDRLTEFTNFMFSKCKVFPCMTSLFQDVYKRQ